MNRKEFLLGVFAASMLSAIGASSASAAGPQGISPGCPKYAVCPQKMKANDKPKWQVERNELKWARGARTNKIGNTRPARRMKRRR